MGLKQAVTKPSLYPQRKETRFFPTAKMPTSAREPRNLFDPIRVPHISATLSDKFKSLLKEFCNTRSKELDDEINKEILSLYKLNSEECEYIINNFI